MNKKIIYKLINKVKEGHELSSEEELQLKEVYEQVFEEELLLNENKTYSETDNQKAKYIRERIAQRTTTPTKRLIDFKFITKIASIFIFGFILSASCYWIWKNNNSKDQTTLAKQEEILPGSNSANLTLSDGSVVSLKNVPDGLIASQDGVRIIKNQDGNIHYKTENNNQADSTVINTINTPIGGQYKVILPDGSIAMLNAASSLSYPVHFSKNERRVKMTGEVYFEIKKITNSNGIGNVPFYVESNYQEIQVLGTQFNINAYDNENSVKTTLKEGSVKVKSNDGQSVQLIPGQQAILNDKLKVKEADMEQELAWVNGDFVFQEAKLASVLRQVERWYNVKTEFPAHIGEIRFNGMISRSQPLSAIIKMIESTKMASVTIIERRLILTD